MGDLLIRNIDSSLKEQLNDSAHVNGRSLSDEAIVRLKQSLASDRVPQQLAGQRLRAIVNDFALTDEEREAIIASRHEVDRAPPSFERGE
jgi:plasmid stability protein